MTGVADYILNAFPWLQLSTLVAVTCYQKYSWKSGDKALSEQMMVLLTDAYILQSVSIS